MNPSMRKWLLQCGASLVVVILASGWGVADEKRPLEPPGVKTKSIGAEWLYALDGGKTFSKDAPPGPPQKNRDGIAPMLFRGTFEIDDPSQVAGMWIRIVEPGEKPRAAICDGDLTAASGGYWKDLGFCPTLLNARLTLNGKEIRQTNGPMLYFWLPVQGEVSKGKNVVELSGDCYTYWGSPPAKAITARLIVAEPQPAAVYNGPVLGDFGDGYFTLACRTQLPAELTVEATPTEPPGKTVTVTSPKKIWHRVKIEVPPGTKAVKYSIRAKVGTHETARGPFAMRFPGPEFRFVALGNVEAHTISIDRWRAYSDRILKADPAFILNTGNCSEHGTWEFDWEHQYCEPAAKLLSSVPTLITPGSRDFAGAVQELHFTPAPNGYSHNWSKTVGGVRFIGLDGNQNWKADTANYAWLEKELKAAKEKFLFVLDAYPGYSTGRISNKPRPLPMQTREVILPLLAKYKVNALISGMDPDYERCEPTPDKGCTQIVAAGVGKNTYRVSGSAIAHNPFTKDKGRDWAFYGNLDQHSFCIFDVKADAVEMRAVQLLADPTKEARVVDKKTFLPR